jgi:orotate phosphoribosyltransferase
MDEAMTRDEILDTFKQTGALLKGHFLLTSGLHSNQYFQCARVLQHPKIAESLCRQLAEHYAGADIAAVIAPAIGGIIVSHETARALGVPALFAERQDGRMTLRRGFVIPEGEKILVVEDVTTTGGSVREVIDLVQEKGAETAGAACLVDRSGGTVDLGVALHPLVRLQVETFKPDACPLCRQGMPVVKPGSRSL